MISLFGATTQPAANEETRIHSTPLQDDTSSVNEDSLFDMEPIPYLNSEPIDMSDMFPLDDLFSDDDKKPSSSCGVPLETQYLSKHMCVLRAA